MMQDLDNHYMAHTLSYHIFGTAHRQNSDSNGTLGGVAAWELQLGS